MRNRRLILKLATAAASCMLALLVAELFLRIFFPQRPSWLDIYVKADSPAYTLQPSTTRLISTGESTWLIYTDANGFRVPKPNAADNRPELLILGDSFTFGMGVNYEQTIPGNFDAALPNFHVVNTGAPGYGPTQYRQILERELNHGAPIAGVIVVTFLGNDFHDCLMVKGEVRNGLLGNEQSLRAAFKRNSHLYRLAAGAYHKLPRKGLEYRPHEWELYNETQWAGQLKPAFDIYQNEMLRIRELCDAHQLPLIGAILPTVHAIRIVEGRDRPEADEKINLPVERAMQAFAAVRIPAIDLTPIFAKAGSSQVFFSWDEHLNPTGSRLAADAILSAWRTAAPTSAP